MKQTLKKLAIILCMTTIVAGVISCENKAKKEAAKQEAEQREMETARKEAEERLQKEIDTAYKAYRFIDGEGIPYTIILNKDKTARLVSISYKGISNTFYGSYYYYDFGEIWLEIKDVYISPNKAITTEWSKFSLYGAVIQDGYLYFSIDDAGAKHPKHRFILHQ